MLTGTGLAFADFDMRHRVGGCGHEKRSPSWCAISSKPSRNAISPLTAESAPELVPSASVLPTLASSVPAARPPPAALLARLVFAYTSSFAESISVLHGIFARVPCLRHMF